MKDKHMKKSGKCYVCCSYKLSKMGVFITILNIMYLYGNILYIYQYLLPICIICIVAKYN